MREQDARINTIKSSNAQKLTNQPEPSAGLQAAQLNLMNICLAKKKIKNI